LYYSFTFYLTFFGEKGMISNDSICYKYKLFPSQNLSLLSWQMFLTNPKKCLLEKLLMTRCMDS
jgi:hypothetical protein